VIFNPFFVETGDMKYLQFCFVLVVFCQYAIHIEAVSAAIFTNNACSGQPVTTIENVPSSGCYSFHGRTIPLIPTSGRLTCNGNEASSTWSADLYGIYSVPPYDFTCASNDPFELSGSGVQCVSIIGSYYAQVNCSLDPAGVKLIKAGPIEASIERTEPFVLRVAPVGNISVGNYLQASYSFLGEIDAIGNVVPDDTSVTPNEFHSIPITDIEIAGNLDFLEADTTDYAFVGYVGGIPQQYTTDVTAAGIALNFVAKTTFSLAQYTVALPGQMEDTTVCLRGSTAGTCTPFTVVAGTLKNALGLYNWTYAAASTHFRVQFNLQLFGLPTATVYFNGDTSAVPGSFTGQITSITWTSNQPPFGFTFTQNIQQAFNKGNNTFGTVAISSSGKASNLFINVDIPLAQLAVPSGSMSYWLYDPDFTVATTMVTASSSASTVAATLIICVASFVLSLFCL